MPSNLFFLDVPLDVGSAPLLEDEEFHHAKSVMRVQEGDLVSLINGKGQEAQALVSSVEKRRIHLIIQSSVTHDIPKTRLTLGVSLLRPSHLDFVVEKAVELKVDRFLLFPADRSERGESSPSLRRRLRALAIAALKQSGRKFLPEFVYLDSLSQALSLASSPLVWADISPEAKTLESALASEKERKELSIFVGPESGWSETEKKLFSESGPPIWLHDTILRAETACIVGAYIGFCWLKQGKIS